MEIFEIVVNYFINFIVKSLFLICFLAFLLFFIVFLACITVNTAILINEAYITPVKFCFWLIQTLTLSNFNIFSSVSKSFRLYVCFCIVYRESLSVKIGFLFLRNLNLFFFWLFIESDIVSDRYHFLRIKSLIQVNECLFIY